jgi:hypothetical protein
MQTQRMQVKYCRTASATASAQYAFKVGNDLEGNTWLRLMYETSTYSNESSRKPASAWRLDSVLFGKILYVLWKRLCPMEAQQRQQITVQQWPTRCGVKNTFGMSAYSKEYTFQILCLQRMDAWINGRTCFGYHMDNPVCVTDDALHL